MPGVKDRDGELSSAADLQLNVEVAPAVHCTKLVGLRPKPDLARHEPIFPWQQRKVA